MTEAGRMRRGLAPRFRDARALMTEVASDLFYRRGIRAIGIEEIAATAGLAKRALYRVFHSKEDLVEECVAADAERLLSAADHLLSDVRDRGQLVRAIGRLLALEMFDGQGRGLFLLNAAVEYPDADHPVREIAAAVVQRLRARLVAVLRPGVADHRDAAAAADHIILLMQGASVGCHSVGGRRSARALDVSIDTLLRHYQFAARSRP